jgi:hypothetical protein
LGFTQEQITKGEIKSTEVLLKMAAAYKAAGSDAAKFGVATSILSTRTATDLIPLLGTSQGELEGAMSRDVVSSEVASQMKAIADQTKVATQALEMFSISLFSYVARAYGSFDAMLVSGYRLRENIESKMGRSQAAFAAGDAVRGKRFEREALSDFESYASSVRMALLGQTIDGQLMDSKTVDGIINQKFAEMFPADMQRRRFLAQQASQGSSSAMAQQTSEASFGVVASSLAQVGGGGGVYAVDMVDLASRTADASERTAAAVEQLAGISPEQSSPVSPK